MSIASLVLLALVQSAGSTTPSQAPAQPPAPTPPDAASADPATLVFPPADAGLVFVAVKADHTADYEALITTLQAALAEADPAARQVAANWRVFKAQELDGKGNAIYVHIVDAPSPAVDYRPSVIVAEIAKSLPEELLVKYRDSFAGAPTRLSLGIVADFAKPPKPKP